MSEEYINNSPEIEDDSFEDTIKVIDDSGKEHEFVVVDAIETDDGRYIALLPSIDEEDASDDEDEDTILIFEVVEEDGEEVLADIESDEVFDSVAAIFEERLNDLYADDDDDGE